LKAEGSRWAIFFNDRHLEIVIEDLEGGLMILRADASAQNHWSAVVSRIREIERPAREVVLAPLGPLHGVEEEPENQAARANDNSLSSWLLTGLFRSTP
jgi:hypothetical protein